MTERQLRHNLSTTHIYIDSETSFDRFGAALKRLAQFLPNTKKGGSVPRSPLLRAFEQILHSASLQEFSLGIDCVVDAGKLLEMQLGQKCHVLEFLYALWADGVIAMPTTPMFASKIAIRPSKIDFGQLKPLYDALLIGSRKNHETQVIGSMLRIAGSTMGIREAGDIHPNTIAPIAIFEHRRHLAIFVDGLTVLHRAEFGDRVPSKEDWGLGRFRAKSFEHDFIWAVEIDAGMEEWRSKLHDWIFEKKRGIALRTYMANRFLAYLLEHPLLPRNIGVYCQRNTVLTMTWTDWAGKQIWQDSSLKMYTNLLAEFFDWYIHTFLITEDDFGRPVPSPYHYNPVKRISRRVIKKVNTHREALPMRYIHELQVILTEEDYKWPKTLKMDWFRRINVMTSQVEKCWSPIRAYAVLLKLMLPLRTFQVRMLDSGEADSIIYSGREWIKNTGNLVPIGNVNICKGFLRKFNDTQTGRVFTGLYVNTNKTADRMKNDLDKGYEIPWENESVIELVKNLCKWQSEFNPLHCPTPWSEIQDKSLLRSNTLPMLLEKGTACFLFRDICGVHPTEPVRDSRLQAFWSMLLLELERRVAARNETLPDGSPLRFVKPYLNNSYPKALYDLHALRVSLITAFAIDGGVPLHILSKCVAGHATILMTLYYTKPGPAHISETLAIAQQKLQRTEQKNFLRFMQNTEISAAKPIVAFNDSAALEAIVTCEPSGWSIGEIGICPVSAAKCAEGGPLHGGRRLPVPGGVRNCLRCRFFVTGPAFLGGLIAKFNVIGLKVWELSAGVRAAEASIRAIEDQEDSNSLESDISSSYEHRDELLALVDSNAHDWHACYALIQRCKEIVKTNQGSGVDLVLAGETSDLETAARECSTFELLDRICQCATIYPSESTPHANLRRAKLIDAMLIRNGRPALFITLTDDEMLAVGNAFVSLLAARLNPNDLNDLIEGQLTLEESGVQQEVDATVKLQACQPVSGAAVIQAIQRIV
ncbi:VPA1269 family protein [Iodobacter sp.]|uniref:gamma-mobile-trio integrase GmtZ n=1 Tax=Iodobacter sp. TaxID=1915058 RepID=UPI0025F93854|nr:VPA1269 family protein [Iodobacter sp.]